MLCVKCYVFVINMLLNITSCLIPTNQSVYSFLIKGVQDAFTHKGLSFTLIILLLNMSSSGLILVMLLFSSYLDDKHDISRGRSALVSQINNVLCFFRTLDGVTKMRLLISYCYSLYGCVIWDITSARVADRGTPSRNWSRG